MSILVVMLRNERTGKLLHQKAEMRTSKTNVGRNDIRKTDSSGRIDITHD
jgi:hypothetical protein